MVHAQELVVFGDNLYSFVIEQDEVLDVIEQSFSAEQTIDEALYGCSVLFYLVSIDFLFFAVHS